MLREIHIDKYNKITTQFRSDVFSAITIVDTKFYSNNIQQYKCTLFI